MTKGLDNRSRDADGTIRRKRSDTKLGTLRAHYGEDFAAHHRSDMELGTLLDQEQEMSLSQYLKKH